MLFSNRNEFLPDSSRIEPIPPNIRNNIVTTSYLNRDLLIEHHDWRKKIMKPHESPPPLPMKRKSIRNDSGDSWPVWNRGIMGAHSVLGGLFKLNILLD